MLVGFEATSGCGGASRSNVALTWWDIGVSRRPAFLSRAILEEGQRRGRNAPAAIVWWLCNLIPEKEEKDCGRGLVLPLYVSGDLAPGWWAMFITMIDDLSAFFGLVFA